MLPQLEQTILQNSNTETIANLMKPAAFPRLTKGAGANFVLSVPHGAINFAVLEFVRGRLGALVSSNRRLSDRAQQLGPTLDFMSSAISTITCSIVSTPQMMITDNIMAVSDCVWKPFDVHFRCHCLCALCFLHLASPC